MSNAANVCTSPVHISTTETIDSAYRCTYLRVKSILDKLVAGILLIVTSPIILLALIAVRVTSRGPVFYDQIRLGRNGLTFRIHKIRSMFHDCESISGPQWSRPGDHRVTPVGRLLRITHIDELPQLVNVLRGEMSLVGPRPERPVFVNQLAEALPRYRERLLAPPGITGLAQIQLKPDTDMRSVTSKLICDLYYVQNMNVWLDLQILLSTPFHLMGIPFSLLSWLFRLPAIRTLECRCGDQREEPKFTLFQHIQGLEPAT
jgi:lipopolysaccharide/colanic/teichoic acid biosynthesis glycosyltransferase